MLNTSCSESLRSMLRHILLRLSPFLQVKLFAKPLATLTIVAHLLQYIPVLGGSIMITAKHAYYQYTHHSSYYRARGGVQTHHPGCFAPFSG